MLLYYQLTLEKRKMKTDPPLPMVDPAIFLKRTPASEPIHLNLRLSGAPLEAYQYLEAHTSEITDSLRIRDCVRVAGLLMLLREKGKPVMVEHAGVEKDLLELMGAFVPETPMDTRKRSK
jgi:hypothetical protein